jgi:hypothetical protein
MKRIFFFFIASLGLLLLDGCAKDDIGLAESASNTGVAGSYARFMIVGDFMYVVDTENIKTFSLADPADPVQVNEQFIGSNIETIFNLNGNLFIGAGSGLFIYTIGPDGVPVQQSEFLYSSFGLDFEPCDPVVANDSIAYVTLNSTDRIQRCRVVTEIQINVLNIFDIKNLEEPILLAQYEMFNPKGVGLDGNLLFLCDDTQGLKIFDVSEPTVLQQLAHFDDFTAFDVIPLGGLLLVVGPDNIYQFDYSDPQNIKKVSEIPISS